MKVMGLDYRREGTLLPVAWPRGRVSWEVAELQRKTPESCSFQLFTSQGKV